MPKAVNYLAPKGTVTLLITSAAVVIVLKGYANIHAEMLSFVNNHISAGSDTQKLLTNLLTIIFQMMMICSLACSYWTMLLLGKDAPNPLFPMVYISLPMLIVMVGIFSF